ncbi:MAG: hypothetical protein KME26_05615 [Oscillatoria princeps RMCB-10]|nr:hypothetical protein [Oscillatoria princeps RMCB-10]
MRSLWDILASPAPLPSGQFPQAAGVAQPAPPECGAPENPPPAPLAPALTNFPDLNTVAGMLESQLRFLPLARRGLVGACQARLLKQPYSQRVQLKTPHFSWIGTAGLTQVLLKL